MKRLCHLATVLIWFTAPVIVFLILRGGGYGSYPFTGLLSWSYRTLLAARNAVFPLILIAQFVPWTIVSVLCFVVPRYPGIRYVLCGIAIIDMVLTLVNPANILTLLWDALYILAVLIATRH